MAKKIESDQTILFVIMGAGVLGLLWILRGKMPGIAGKQPKVQQTTPTIFYDTNMWPFQHGQHYVPADMILNPVSLPVRYPTRPGHEISSLVEQGYAPLFRARNGLDGWLNNPPANQE